MFVNRQVTNAIKQEMTILHDTSINRKANPELAGCSSQLERVRLGSQLFFRTHYTYAFVISRPVSHAWLCFRNFRI